jgi:hypothetical protein
MSLSAPKKTTYLVAVIAGAVGVLLHYHVVHVAILAPYAVLLVVAGWATLAVACFARGL